MHTQFLNFFNQIFVKKRSNEPFVQFGNYSDRNKTAEQVRLWKNSLIFYEENNFFQAIENFFKYVKDPELDNLNYKFEEDKYTFSFFQGSKQIFGEIDNESIIVHSDIVEYSELSEEFMQFILTVNHRLKFSKFLIDDSNILKIELKLKTKHTNPIALYSALREIAIIADEYDDLLIQKYSFFESLNTGHIQQLSTEEVYVKIKYYRKWFEETLESLEKYDAVKFVAARSFLLLHLIYKIHFLISPEGELLQEINNIHKIFHASDNKTDFEKNAIIVRIIKKLSYWSDDKIRRSLYFAYSTFPIEPPVDSKVVIDFAINEIDKIHWYADNNHDDVARAVAEYIIGFACYNYDTIPIMNEILGVFWEVLYCEYFANLNFKNIPVDNGQINYIALNQGFNSLNSFSQKDYPKFNFNIKHLNIADFYEFAMSYIYEFINLDFSDS